MTDKKKLITVISLLLVLAVFLTAFLVMKSHNEKNTVPEDATPDTTVKVTEKTADEMSHLIYVYDGKEYSFTRNTDTTWSLDSDALFPVESNTVDTMASVISAVEAEKTVENGDTDAFGFDAPQLTVKGEYSDGSKIDLVFGKTNAFNELVYLKDALNGKIYMVASTVISPFKAETHELIKTDSLPTDIDEEYINGLTVTDETGASNTITDEYGLKLTEAMELFYKLEFPASTCVYTDKEGLAEYGIGGSKAALELSYKATDVIFNDDGTSTSVKTDTSFEIIFGDSWIRQETIEGSDGEPYVEETVFYYYTVPDSTIVYSINGNDYEKLMAYVYETPEVEDETEAVSQDGQE